MPLWGNYSSVVWSCPEEMCEELQQLSEVEFILEINKALHNSSDATFIGSCPDFLPSAIKKKNFEAPPLIETLETKRWAFPLILNHANNLAANRMALIGDAAHRVHPLAGQGLNLGLTDVAYLSNCILRAMKTGQDIGSYDFVLKDYEQEAKANAYVMSTAIEFVKTAYSPKFGNN